MNTISAEASFSVCLQSENCRNKECLHLKHQSVSLLAYESLFGHKLLKNQTLSYNYIIKFSLVSHPIFFSIAHKFVRASNIQSDFRF